MTENTKELRDSCGVFGIVAAGEWPTKLEVTELIYLGLIAIQHRGQESSGMVTSYGEKDNMKIHRRPGLASKLTQTQT
ncbi:hypothetical protein CDAR_79061 [Caerostris darwini]|uniref:Glutamine amidotransferase type-2 domain-containing protein n=1 Tax=Caerostris darwini TaxID=1538125 RepID=A0AAV4S495_9ARAC|nr:hypothetical protein CDAR_79061 [Caerostris darwini]